MLISYSLPFWLAIACFVVAGLCLLNAVRHTPWRTLQKHSAYQHLTLGSLVTLVLVWSGLNFNVEQSVVFHPLLITSATLILGFPLAFLTASLALVGVCVFKNFDLLNLGANILIGVLVPAAASRGLVMLIRRSNVQNLFLYTLGAGFGGGALATLACALSSLALSYVASPLLFDINLESVPLYFLLLFPEAFINGTLVTSLAVMHPQLVKTYDDDFYLKKHD